MSPTVDRPGFPAAVRATLPIVVVIMSLAYGLVHAAWLIIGTPAVAARESPFVGGAVLAASGGLGALAGIWLWGMRRGVVRPRWAGVVIGGLAGVLLAAHGLAFWPGTARFLLVPFGQPVGPGELAVWGLGLTATAAGLGLIMTVIPIARSLRGACPHCGRVPGAAAGDRHTPAPGWARAAAALGVAGLALRLGAQLLADPASLFQPSGAGGPGFVIFVVIMVLAGTVLPVTLVGRWGRLWPGWVPRLAGRPVPRWLVLGPACFISAGLLLYFGAGGLVAVATGLTSPEAAPEIIGYVLWGAGLAVASVSYAAQTRRTCAHHVIDRSRSV